MSDPYIGEIRMFAGNFAPVDWAFCNGSLVSISDYDTLFNLIGTTYGGDGQTTFALPDLRGRVPMHSGQGASLSPRSVGQNGGLEAVTVNSAQLPAHTHTVGAYASNGTASSPAGAVWAASQASRQYIAGASASVALNAATITAWGGNQPHNNMLPFLAINFIISLYGIYPSQN